MFENVFKFVFFFKMIFLLFKIICFIFFNVLILKIIFLK
jgi:hypothetical protein